MERRKCHHRRMPADCDSSAGRLLPLYVLERETGRRVISRKWSRAIEAHMRRCTICWLCEITWKNKVRELEAEYLDQTGNET